LNNLPAAVVDKIRVIDRESESVRSSGIQDGSREKVLDVGLKKEYEKGWFGNIGVKGGMTVGGKEESPLQDNRGLLYSGNALVSAYNEKDQITLIANGLNVSDANAVFVIVDDGGESPNMDQGLSAAAQLGVNMNTSRIKDVATTVGANYKYTDTDFGSRAERTTFLDGGNLASSSENSGKQYANSLNANMEFEKEEGKVWFHLRPSFQYTKTDTYKSGSSETFRNGLFVNSSEKSTHSLSEGKSGDVDADISFRDLWGKKNRVLRFDASVLYNTESGESDENSTLMTDSGTDVRRLQYVSDNHFSRILGALRYTEPLGEKWTLSTEASFSRSKRDNVRDAFDVAGRNDYYSSVSRTDYREQKYELTAQFKFNENSLISFGASALGLYNETFSKNRGIENVTGRDEWLWSVIPTLRFNHNKGNNRISFGIWENSRRPNASQVLPVLNVSDPARLSLGNIYLKQYTQPYFYTAWSHNNRERFSTLMLYLSGNYTVSPICQASWYDAAGIIYSIPVNSQKPRLNTSLIVNFTTPLDSKKIWSMTINSSCSYSSSVNYQTRTTLKGLEKDSFDYFAFMSEFWGDASGNRFYGGLSGFSESRTRSLNPNAGLTVKYNQDHYSFSVGANVRGAISRYSLDPSVNMNTLDTRLKASGTYSTKHEFEFDTDISYVFYKGYAEGYGQPELQWNGEISKSIGAFNLSIKVNDILNQTRNLTHTVNANYEEDTYRLIMGRYILFGVKWNFGKMNAAHNQRARAAAWSML
jgi:hypothetical protein